MTYSPIPSEQCVEIKYLNRNFCYLKSTARATQNRLACHLWHACHRLASADVGCIYCSFLKAKYVTRVGNDCLKQTCIRILRHRRGIKMEIIAFLILFKYFSTISLSLAWAKPHHADETYINDALIVIRATLCNKSVGRSL